MPIILLYVFIDIYMICIWHASNYLLGLQKMQSYVKTSVWKEMLMGITDHHYATS